MRIGRMYFILKLLLYSDSQKRKDLGYFMDRKEAFTEVNNYYSKVLGCYCYCLELLMNI